MANSKRRDDVVVTFDRLTVRGEASTLVNGIELRVPGGIPGERAAVTETRRSKGGPVAWGKIAHLHDPSPARRSPPCSLEGRCGGCGLQHIQDADQLDIKVASACHALPPSLTDRLAPREEWVRSPPWDWRHKSVLLPGLRGERLLLGGYARGSHDVVDLPDCAVLAPSLREARESLRGPLKQLVRAGLQLCPPGSALRAGALRALVLRAPRGGGVLATAVVTSRSPTVRALLRSLVESGALAGAFEHVHSGTGDSIRGDGPVEHLAGAAFAIETIAGVPLPLLPMSFFQVNPAVLEGMVERLRIEVGTPKRLVDAYCGVGAVGLAVASGLDAAPRLVGCDTAADAVEAATGTAATLGLEASYETGRPEDTLRTTEEDVVLVDPPRKGCSQAALAALVQGRPKGLLYISCSTASLARDSERLKELGYHPQGLWAADMVPQTAHLEWVARFSSAGRVPGP
jgi:23S rRNA (uracil1939-C5)-methyltransferase